MNQKFIYTMKQDMRLIGKLTAGMHTDDCLNIHPDVIQEYYGVTNKQSSNRCGQSGAGNAADDLLR